MSNLHAVRDALAAPFEPPIDGFDPANDDRHGGDGGRPPLAMPDDCPVIPVGTEDGVFYFLTALGELRALTCDKVANKHIVGMFAPEAEYLEETWPRQKLVQATDPKTGAKIEDADGNPVMKTIVTGWRNDDVAMLLMNVAARKGVWNPREKVRGRGAWTDDDGRLVLHTGNHVLINGRWERPGEYDGMVYPTAPPIPKPARDAHATAEAVAPELTGQLRARGLAIAADATPGMLLFEMVKTWSWVRPHIDPLLLIGWIGAAMLGGALDYRPLAWITGGKETGKSALQELMDLIFDGGILQSPDASEAAVRQVLGQQSLPVGIDEAEADADNRKILALVKLARLAATSQGNILRGGQDHKGHEFQATSCFLFSSILVPPIPPQDRSRLAMLELNPLPSGARKPRFVRREIAAIGAWLRRRLADQWHRWPDVLEAFGDALIDYGGHSGRAADQFGTLLAAAHVLLNDGAPDHDELEDWGQMLARTRLAETADLSDEPDLCLAHLASTQVQLAGHGTPRLVAEWILDASAPDPGGGLGPDPIIADKRAKAEGALARVGLRVLFGRAAGADAGEGPRMVPGRAYLAIASNHQGLARLYETSRWKEGVWSQAVRRVEGALAGQQRIGGQSLKCTLVPVSAIVERDEAEPARADAEYA